MKKIYILAIASLFAGSMAMAQTTVTKTLTSHFENALTNPQSPQISVYSWGVGNGWVSGNNTYGDLADVQKFDNSFGVSGDGTIDSVRVYIPIKNDPNGTATFKIALYEDNNGAIGNLIAESSPINLSSVDTTQTGIKPIFKDGAPTTFGGLYNVKAAFTGANIPSNHSFFAGVVLPTTAAAGDTLAILTSKNGLFDHAGYSGAIASDGTFDDWNQYSVKVALAIFPTITVQSPVAVTEISAAQVKLYPNPVRTEINFDFGSDKVASINVTNLNGQVIFNANVENGTSKINVNSLENGMYFYQALDANKNIMTTGKFVKE